MSYEWGNGRKGAAIEVGDVDLKRVPLEQRLDLIRALHDAEADPDCVCSWLHNPIKASITYTVVGPEAKVEAFKQAAMAVVQGGMG